jgi:hypothetical protein
MTRADRCAIYHKIVERRARARRRREQVFPFQVQRFGRRAVARRWPVSGQ